MTELSLAKGKAELVRFHEKIDIVSPRGKLFEIFVRREETDLKFSIIPSSESEKFAKVAIGSHIAHTDESVLLATVYAMSINGRNDPFYRVGEQVFTLNCNNFVISPKSSMINVIKEAVRDGNAYSFQNIVAAYTSLLLTTSKTTNHGKIEKTLRLVAALINASEVDGKNGPALLRLRVWTNPHL